MKGNRKVTMEALLGNPSDNEEWLLARGFVKDDISGVWTLTRRPDCLDFLDDWDIKVVPTMKGEWEARVWYAPRDGGDAPKYMTSAWLTPKLAVINLVQYLENIRIASWTTERLQKLMDKYFPAPREEKDPDLQWLYERGFTPALFVGNCWNKTIGEMVVSMVKRPEGEWEAGCMKNNIGVKGAPSTTPKSALMLLMAVMASNGNSPFTEDDE